MFDETVLIRAWFIADLAVSTITIILNVFIILKRRKLLRHPIFPAITLLQVLAFAKSIIQILTAYCNFDRDLQCRVIIFFGLVTSIAPIFASDFCVIYLQLVLINQVSRERRKPFLIITISGIACSIVPESLVLMVPPHLLNMKSYCEYDKIPSKELIIFKWFNSLMWVIVGGIEGIISLYIIFRYIWKRSSNTTDKSIRSSDDAATATVQDIEEARKIKKTRINHALLRISWVPITPIISMWFAVCYATIRYAKQRDYMSLDIINVCLQSLAVPFISLIFYVYKPVRQAYVSVYHEYKRRIWHRFSSNDTGVYPKAAGSASKATAEEYQV